MVQINNKINIHMKKPNQETVRFNDLTSAIDLTYWPEFAPTPARRTLLRDLDELVNQPVACCLQTRSALIL